jgi:predicted dehydrogenase
MDTDHIRLGAFGEKFSVAGCYPRLADLLRGEQPDLVHICTPPSTHYGTARECLDAGASVLVEKPPVITLEELDGLTAAQGVRGAPWFATVFQHRFGGGQLRLKELIKTGVLGRPLLAICHTTWFRDQAYFDVPWRGNWETEGGGPTMGHGIHQMDMLLDVLGDWTEVTAIARTQARDMHTEDLSLAHVAFAGGAVASVVNSVLSPREESYLRFDFEHATVEVTHLYGYTDADWKITPAEGHEDEITTAWKTAGSVINGGAIDGSALKSSVPSSSAPSSSAPSSSAAKSGHAGQFARVIAALRAGQPPPVTPGEARRTMALIAGIYASAFTRRRVSPGDLAPGSPFYGAMNAGLTWR